MYNNLKAYLLLRLINNPKLLISFNLNIFNDMKTVWETGSNTLILKLINHKGHWLPVWSHLHFKINLITYKAVTFHLPPSLWDLPHSLCSTWAISLFRPFARGFGTRAYANYSPKVWNVLPESVVLGRSLLSARPLRPTTLTILPSPPNLNYNHSLLSAVIVPSR